MKTKDVFSVLRHSRSTLYFIIGVNHRSKELKKEGKMSAGYNCDHSNTKYRRSVLTLPWPLKARAVLAQRLATTEQSVVISCTKSISFKATIESSSLPDSCSMLSRRWPNISCGRCHPPKISLWAPESFKSAGSLLRSVI